MPAKCERKVLRLRSDMERLKIVSQSRRNKCKTAFTPISKSTHETRPRTIGMKQKSIFVLRAVLQYPRGIDDFSDSELINSMNIHFHRQFATSKTTFPDRRDRKSLFFSSEEPTILFPSYLRRSVKYGNCYRFHFLKAIELLRRIGEVNGLALNPINFHRLYISALTIAIEQSQFVDDELMARIGGVPSLTEMRKLKECFKEHLGSNTNVSFNDMEQVLNMLSTFKTAVIVSDEAISEMRSH